MECNYTFLLIEDNVIDQIVASHLIKKALATSEITIVNNGKEAICWLKTYESKLNSQLIILSDINMPVMDGFGFLSEFDGLPEALKNQTEIFMLSTTLFIDEINQCKRNPYVEGFFSKPLPIEKFLNKIAAKQMHKA